MINYRVDDLDELLDQLKQNGVEVLKGPDGNKIELWEPVLMDDKN